MLPDLRYFSFVPETLLPLLRGLGGFFLSCTTDTHTHTHNKTKQQEHKKSIIGQCSLSLDCKAFHLQQIHMYVCMYVCMYVRMYVCMYIAYTQYAHVYVYTYLHICTSINIHVHVLTCICIHTFLMFIITYVHVAYREIVMFCALSTIGDTCIVEMFYRQMSQCIYTGGNV